MQSSHLCPFLFYAPKVVHFFPPVVHLAVATNKCKLFLNAQHPLAKKIYSKVINSMFISTDSGRKPNVLPNFMQASPLYCIEVVFGGFWEQPKG